MPKTNSPNKAVRSFRMSREGTNQLYELAHQMGRSESNVLEIALDRMYREEIRFNRSLREVSDPESNYQKREE